VCVRVVARRPGDRLCTIRQTPHIFLDHRSELLELIIFVDRWSRSRGSADCRVVFSAGKFGNFGLQKEKPVLSSLTKCLCDHGVRFASVLVAIEVEDLSCRVWN